MTAKSVDELFQNLQSDIKMHGHLSSPEATGFYAMHCPICRKEDRKTGGFKFEADKIVYNCFRGSCDASTVYELGNYIPRKFKALMREMSITIPMGLRLQKSATGIKTKRVLDASLYKEHVYKQQDIPEGWVPIFESEHPKVEVWADYLGKRACSLADVFMIESGKYRGLAAIGMYYFDRLIGFQILVDGNGKKKYLTETINDNLIYIPERRPESVMIVCEGLLDAKCFPNTVATMHSKLSPEQAYHLRDSELWFLPDRGDNKFIDQFAMYPNAKMIVPNWKHKDLNAAVMDMGVMEVAERIRECLISDKKAAKMKYNLWRKTKK